jgi:hypothetical protein
MQVTEAGRREMPKHRARAASKSRGRRERSAAILIQDLSLIYPVGTPTFLVTNRTAQPQLASIRKAGALGFPCHG